MLTIILATGMVELNLVYSDLKVLVTHWVINIILTVATLHGTGNGYVLKLEYRHHTFVWGVVMRVR